MIRFGVSGLPPDGDDAAFLDGLVAKGHRAYELAFVKGFPWKEARCRRFGELAAERDIWLSVHAPYFAVLTVEEPDRGKQTRAALEHTVKLGRELAARTVVAHAGYTQGRSPEQLLQVVGQGLEMLAPKIQHLGVSLGLETSGTTRSFGTLGDVALLAKRFSFVRPVVDWAHVHAMSGGALTSREAFLSVFGFLREEFPGWMVDPLQAQFTDNQFGPRGEIRHIPYGEGTLRIGPLVEAAAEAGVRMVLISEAHDEESHQRMLTDLEEGLAEARSPSASATRPLARVELPSSLTVARDGEAFVTQGTDRPVRLSNVDKVFFPQDGYTKGDLLQYYAAVAPLLLPHLSHRAIVLARFPDGAEGAWFYEKECPSHRPPWLATAPLHSEHRGQPINYCTAPDLESLLWIVNLGCIELHPWLSRVTTPEHEDFAIFDLDPAEGATWEQVVRVARLVEVALDRLGLRGYLKTSGATGLHVYVPLEPAYPYRRVRRFVEAVGRLIVGANPDDATMEWDIPRRAGKVFIDHNQNVGGKTIASVYSVRPRPGVPVSVPVLWEELERVGPDSFTIVNLWDRLQRYGDLFAPVLQGGQRLESAEEALGLAG
ncbi:MAG: non-homologous end-joining DNA ligase [Acidimicrobiia bacterium]